MITTFARCRARILAERRGKYAVANDCLGGGTASGGGPVTTARSRLLMRHLLSWQRLGQLLGDEAAENLDHHLACSVGQLRPKLHRARLQVYRARGGKEAIRMCRMAVLLEGLPDASSSTRPVSRAPAIRLWAAAL